MSKPLRVHVIQHVWFENAGAITAWARERGHLHFLTEVDKGRPLPKAAEIDFLILLGGPMSVHDDLAFLHEERRLIGEVLTAKKPLLGICLGAQLLAQTLGADVYRMQQKEIGWKDVHFKNAGKFYPFVDGSSFTTLHWHGEAFTLPKNAQALASSELAPVQAFSYGDNVVAMQFHPEMIFQDVEALVAECGNTIHSAANTEQPPQEILMHARKHCELQKPLMFGLLDALTK